MKVTTTPVQSRGGIRGAHRSPSRSRRRSSCRDLARAQGAHTRNLVVLYLSGGNDSLSMLVPYNDPFYYSRRPTLAVPAGPSAADRHRFVEGRARPASAADRAQADLRSGPARAHPAHRLPNQSRSHFQGTDIWSTADPDNAQALGWVGRYLDSLPSPVDPLIGWNTTGALPHVLQSSHTGGARDIRIRRHTRSPVRTRGAEAAAERSAALRITSHVPVDRPELAFVYGSAQAALATLDRVATVAQYAPIGDAIRTTGLGQALRAVAGAMANGIGTKRVLRDDRRLRHALGTERQRRPTARTTT